LKILKKWNYSGKSRLNRQESAEKGGELKLKEYDCIQVNHHKEVPSAIAEMQNQGWRLHTYQATGIGTDVKHYLLFEKGN
jgi:hypothetical protein